MTSANRTEEPILISDARAFDFGADGVLWHERAVRTPMDDSVVRRGPDGKELVIRRGRGFVPLPIYVEGLADTGCALAMGGDLKAAFGLRDRGYCVLSQPFGDLIGCENLKAYRQEIGRMLRIFHARPREVVCDLHPGYQSARVAEEMELPVRRVQHHYAHTLAVMAEHELAGPVLGISFDGTGYGTDGTVWGGELLVCDREGFTRCGHLSSTAMLGADESARDAGLSALCHLRSCGVSENLLEDRRHDIVGAALRAGINTVETTSVGRMFDAVCAALGICGYNRYEGECGVRLEQCAARARREGVAPAGLTLELRAADGGFVWDQERFWRELMLWRDRPGAAALGFHAALARACRDGALWARDRYGFNQVALSGGVFQNMLLLELVTDELARAGFQVYRNIKAPVNDGAIALGQLYAK